MASKVHMICAKCGSDEMYFDIEKRENHVYYDPDDGVGVFIVCTNCSELTGVEEWNEFNGQQHRNP